MKQTCRFCGEELSKTFLDLGLSPLSNEYILEDELDKGQVFFPLHVRVCSSCKLVQAALYRRPEEIFHEYKYYSSFSSSWLKHCRDYVDMITKRLQLDSNSMVFEIACNDGYLLQYFIPKEIPVLGIEPADNVADEARRKGIDVETCFWGEDTAKDIIQKKGRADLIIGNNVLAHVPDINSFVKGVSLALKDNGTVTFEFPHLMKLMEYNQFDTIYHEHFSYLSLYVVEQIFTKHGLKAYDVEELETHGGSLRVYAAKVDNKSITTRSSVERLHNKEEEFGISDIKTYADFYKKVRNIKYNTIKVLSELKTKGKKIVAFGAAAKGNTFLNYCGIGREYVDYVVDSNQEKQGMYLPGTLIPIKSPDVIREDKPDYIILLPWNLKKELTDILKYTSEWGCKLITFIPDMEVISY